MSRDENDSPFSVRDKAPAAPIDRASESIVNSPASIGRQPIIREAAISSGEIELGPDSFTPVAASTAHPRVLVSEAPPSAVVANAMDRGKSKMPLSTMVGIAAGLIVVLVGLALLLFR